MTFPDWGMFWPDIPASLKELAVDCDLTLPGVWEVGRSGSSAGFADFVDGFRNASRSEAGARGND